MDYEQNIASALAEVLNAPPFELGRDVQELQGLLEVPRDRKLGDLAFPCFTLAKALRKAPPAIAADVAEQLATRVDSIVGIASAVAVGPYVNFALDSSDLALQVIPGILSGEFLEARPATGERVMIEYSQPNTHKAFHVGHTRNVALGDALVRICEWAGHDVVAANYIGDVGTHIAKCLWYYTEFFDGVVPDENRGEFLGGLYQQAELLLDFQTLTKSPHPNVISALVKNVTPHPSKDAWQIVEVDTGSGNATVVCGGQGFAQGDFVPYAQPGAHIGGRLVGTLDKEGVESVGMICSEKEISLSDDARKIAVLPADTLGQEVAEIYRVADALPADQSVVAEMTQRQEGVATVLKRLEAQESPIHELWQETRQWSLDDFEAIYQWLEARFDHVFYESDVGDAGKKIVHEYHDKGVLVKSEGAIGAELSRFKLPFFLLLKSNGTGLYSTKDIALARLKFEEFQIDKSVYVVDARQSLHFQQVFKTLELMGYEQAKQCFHLAYGMVTLPEGAMSSRKGTVILFSQLKKLLTDYVTQTYLEDKDWSAEQIEDAARRVALATIRYGMLNQDNKKDIVFCLEDWADSHGNTGPYLLYAYTRTQSILRKSGGCEVETAQWELLAHDTENKLLGRLRSFPEVVEKAAADYAPQNLCYYLYELCRDFSRFYDACPVKAAENDSLRNSRACLVAATGRVIQKGLALLGIETLDQM